MQIVQTPGDTFYSHKSCLAKGNKSEDCVTERSTRRV
jgi:hypothetical protein